MIIDAFITFGYLFLLLIHWILSVVSLVIPVSATNAVTWFFSKVFMFNGIFPIVTLTTVALFVISVWVAKYLLIIMLWAISFIPGIGEHKLPEISQTVRYNREGMRTGMTERKRFRIWRRRRENTP